MFVLLFGSRRGLLQYELLVLVSPVSWYEDSYNGQGGDQVEGNVVTDCSRVNMDVLTLRELLKLPPLTSRCDAPESCSSGNE